MNSKFKNKIRNASNSKQSHSNLASNSKQKITITKYKSEKNIFFKNKNSSHNRSSKSKQHSKNSSRCGLENNNQIRILKTAKGQLPSEEYYNHVKKAKSKSKKYQHHPDQIERQKKSYFQSLYMHKEDELNNQDIIQNSFQKINQNKNSPLNTNLKMIKKIKIIEKHAAIDSNGKFVQRQVKKMNQRKADSQQHTFSVFDNTKNSIAGNTQLQNKKSSQNLKLKRQNQPKKLKTKNSQLYQAGVSNQKKSCLKSVIKLKKHTSSGKDQNVNKKSTQSTNELLRFRNTREATRLQTQRQTIQTSSSKTIQSLQTQASPHFIIKNNFISSLQMQIVSFQQIIQQIMEQKQNLKILRTNITNSDYLAQRIKAIDFIGKICHLMSIKRQAHSLAVIFLDNYIQLIINSLMKQKEKRKLFKINQEYINFPDLIKNLKLFSITCLLVALKMDDGLMARKLCFQINTNLQNLLKSSTSKMNQKMKDSIANLNGYNSTSTTKETRRQSVYSLSKSKTNISNLSSVKSFEQKQTRKSKKEQFDIIQMNNIIKVQTDMLMKFKFKLTIKSPQYWTDMLTYLWDDYINDQISWQQSLYFRQASSTSNISHLLQLLQKSYLSLQVYQFPTSTVVLAIMYLIIRIKLQQQKQSQNIKALYEKYRYNLSKSTNIIFYDNIGINQLFGDFLIQMNMNLSDIVNAVKYVGQYLLYQNLKSFTFNNKSKQINNRFQIFQHRLSLYQYNAEVYMIGLYK